MSCGPPGGFYCGTHACHHLAKQYPDEFGVMRLGPKEQQRQENQRSTRFILIAIAVVLGFLLLCWLWSQPSNGNSETKLVYNSSIFSS
jgi:hypothetical protein